MSDPTLAAQSDAWRAELLRSASTCATYYARRVPHWIAIGARIWGTQGDLSPATGHSLPDELMVSARREIELRGEYTRRVLGELAERSIDPPPSAVLADCASLADELMRGGCRDVGNDIEHASRFLHGMDATCASHAISRAISDITDHLLDVIQARADLRA
jgi:hypothetical protein